MTIMQVHISSLKDTTAKEIVKSWTIVFTWQQLFCFKILFSGDSLNTVFTSNAVTPFCFH